MSTFNGTNYFGSGPHQIVVNGLLIAKQRSGYAGVDGVESKTVGGRGWPVVITGQLRAANRTALNVLIAAIEAACYLGDCTLIDADSCSYDNVELDNIILIGKHRYSGNAIIINYIVRGTKLY